MTTGTGSDRIATVATILVHVTCGPENPTKAALGFLVAKAAVDEGHRVTMFLAGDGVQLLRDSVLDSLGGLGTGSLRESYDAVVAAGTQIYASGMSSKARGLTEDDLVGKPVELALPARLVQLSLEADRVLTY
jgi:predicted peroxiredoxin